MHGLRPQRERSIIVYGSMEAALTPLMEEVERRFASWVSKARCPWWMTPLWCFDKVSPGCLPARAPNWFDSESNMIRCGAFKCT